jgi:hypothetical protein
MTSYIASRTALDLAVCLVRNASYLPTHVQRRLLALQPTREPMIIRSDLDTEIADEIAATGDEPLLHSLSYRADMSRQLPIILARTDVADTRRWLLDKVELLGEPARWHEMAWSPEAMLRELEVGQLPCPWNNEPQLRAMTPEVMELVAKAIVIRRDRSDAQLIDHLLVARWQLEVPTRKALVATRYALLIGNRRFDRRFDRAFCGGDAPAYDDTWCAEVAAAANPARIDLATVLGAPAAAMIAAAPVGMTGRLLADAVVAAVGESPRSYDTLLSLLGDASPASVGELLEIVQGLRALAA